MLLQRYGVLLPITSMFISGSTTTLSSQTKESRFPPASLEISPDTIYAERDTVARLLETDSVPWIPSIFTLKEPDTQRNSFVGYTVRGAGYPCFI
ncbi:hypothetical protein BDQ94DRAFT_149060 [Aspergillus welwitschiae]|uniref:Uncharacterized protein n=1 Tax=Aspergillus welwitschiae TaxID=1341132 RepID=A0A3F3PU42_9EURO|nr:hypothetical protein BDQ94DRAFT_149060 [Aspergillus welwitschiae]RDH30439.1 hypothetical protein BDQ94DRAFT_149060 [Aspergillus welwitschiae]